MNFSINDNEFTNKIASRESIKPVCTITLSGKVNKFNELFLTELEFKASELLGENLSKILFREDQKYFQKALIKAQQNGCSHFSARVFTKFKKVKIFSWNMMKLGESMNVLLREVDLLTFLNLRKQNNQRETGAIATYFTKSESLVSEWVKEEKVSLKSLFLDSFKEVRQEFNRRDVICDFGRLPKVPVDKKVLSKVFKNLLYNSMYFLTDNLVIKIEATLLEDRFQIKIIDSGVGILHCRRGEKSKKFKHFPNHEFLGDQQRILNCISELRKIQGSLEVISLADGGNIYQVDILI